MSLAYFITFHAYGTWLHGDERGSVDRDHNTYSEELVPPDFELHRYRKELMKHPPYYLDAPRRETVFKAIMEHAAFKGWRVLALQVRTTHVHLVVTTEASAERVMNECKSYASRALNAAGLDAPGCQRWSRHGSTRHLFDEQAVSESIHYVVERQGEPMSVYRAEWK